MYYMLTLSKVIFIFSTCIIELKASEKETQKPNKHRIIGGHVCELHKSKFMIALTNYNGYHVCGGSLVKPHWVLTAAHCEDADTQFYASDSITREKWVNKQGVLSWWTPVSKVTKIFSHPNFNRDTTVADIALMKLKKPFRETLSIEFVKIPDQETLEDTPQFCPMAAVMGWGTTSRSGITIPTTLRCAEINTLPFGECRALVSVPPRTMCTQPNTKKDTCYGDSGGPLMCGNTQYGIASWGVECASKWPAIYTRVDQYLHFIHDTIAKNSKTRINGYNVFTFCILYYLYTHFIIN